MWRRVPGTPPLTPPTGTGGHRDGECRSGSRGCGWCFPFALIRMHACAQRRGRLLASSPHRGICCGDVRAALRCPCSRYYVRPEPGSTAERLARHQEECDMVQARLSSASAGIDLTVGGGAAREPLIRAPVEFTGALSPVSVAGPIVPGADAAGKCNVNVFSLGLSNTTEEQQVYSAIWDTTSGSVTARNFLLCMRGCHTKMTPRPLPNAPRRWCGLCRTPMWRWRVWRRIFKARGDHPVHSP